MDLIEYLQTKSATAARLVELVRNSNKRPAITVSGVAGSLKSVVLGLLHRTTGRQILFVARDRETALAFRDDAGLICGQHAVSFYDDDRAKTSTPSGSRTSTESIETLRSLLDSKEQFVVTYARAIGYKLPKPDFVNQATITVTTGSRLDLGAISRELSRSGFERKDFVEHPGDYSLRGGIVDVFPFVGHLPVRIEFFGDDVESIREFDPVTQRSERSLASARLVPDIMEHQREEQEVNSTILDYLHPDAIVVLDEPALIAREFEGAEAQSPMGWDGVAELLALFQQVHILDLGKPAGIDVLFDAISQPAFNGSVRLLKDYLMELIAGGFSIHLACDSQSERDRLRDLLTISAPEVPAEHLPEQLEEHDQPLDVSHINFSLEGLHHGFVLREARLAVLTEHQVFNRLKRRGGRRRPRFKGFTQKDIHELRKGDFVVHEDHGVGRFDGLHRIQVRNVEQEVLRILYEENDTLYVNLNHLAKVQKFSSKDGHIPKLSRLGSADWERLKTRAKKKIKDIARDLIQLYARRKSSPGYAFPIDTPWQKELEASFMYEDTFDQAKATREVKMDMEAANPMDRLICGDVGFGKTEVAVRAAFKAVLSGKQVAVLVPTTILAMQHFETFRSRMGRYALTIEVLSRFKSKKEQASIVERLSVGTVDIVIGTHRLLSKDVGFKNIGLLIIDEEHRFGVSAKEKIRKIRTDVDTLALTATPIPRTLHFSLLGARDLSIIATPPRNRLPVVTEIGQPDSDLIRDAILREVHRGGQVYVVHDRIQALEQSATQLQSLVPEARIRTAHGQMPAHELEEAMVDFLERKFDVLVCTKIIESGLDIPNVNTIVVHRADRFGMAELYQLRGRVGRSNIQAYSYLLVPPISVLPKATLQRLQALEEFTDLGAGFNLAMRDLEIRGAGNLLGAEQSGYIDTMGFETYSKLLEEAVAELRDQEFSDLFEGKTQSTRRDERTMVEVDVEALIPSDYVENDFERLALYRRLYSVSSMEQLHEVEEEMRDRFGRLPPPVENLIEVVRIRLEASKLGLKQVKIGGEEVEIEFPPQSDSGFYEGATFQYMMEVVSKSWKKRLGLEQTAKSLILKAPLYENGENTRFSQVHDLLRLLAPSN